MDLIKELQSINFVCLDDDKEERATWIRVGFDFQAEFLAEKIGNKGYVSLKTRQLQIVHSQTKSYDDFHLCAHHIMIDYIISHVALGTEIELSTLIEETLRCSENKNAKLISKLYNLTGINRIAA